MFLFLCFPFILSLSLSLLEACFHIFFSQLLNFYQHTNFLNLISHWKFVRWSYFLGAQICFRMFCQGNRIKFLCNQLAFYETNCSAKFHHKLNPNSRHCISFNLCIPLSISSSIVRSPVLLRNWDSKSLMNFLCLYCFEKKRAWVQREKKKRSHFRSNMIVFLPCNHPQNIFFSDSVTKINEISLRVWKLLVIVILVCGH